MEEGGKGEAECPQDDEAATSAFEEHGEGQELPLKCPGEAAGVAGCANAREELLPTAACRAPRADETTALAALEAARCRVHLN
jgi:hypothetical protein